MNDRRKHHQFRLLGERRSEERQRLLQILSITIPFALLAVVAVGFMIFSFTTPLRIGPPYTYSQETYAPVVSTVCPGDLLTYHYGIAIQRGPARVTITQTWFDRTARRSALTVPTTTNTTMIVLAEDIGTRDEVGSAIVPQLPPGQYELREAAGESTSTVATMSVPFVVKAGCT